MVLAREEPLAVRALAFVMIVVVIKVKGVVRRVPFSY